ncbi:MAG TPA: RNA methyltransferase [Candidatus Korarchaeota archaeon]|nr:RNA methyltransferase [Candidatus Korarchaeota archaeon]
MLEDFNLLITCSRGQEEDARIETISVLKQIGDPNPIVEKTSVRGLLTAKTGMDPVEAIKKMRELLKERPVSFLYIKRAIPIQKIIRTDLEEIGKVARELGSKIGEDETFRVTVEKRHTDLRTMEIIKAAASGIDRKVNLDNPDRVILVEVIGPLTGISLIRPQDILSTQKELK